MSQDGRNSHWICTGEKVSDPLRIRLTVSCLLLQSSYTSDVKQAGRTASAQQSPFPPSMWADTAPRLCRQHESSTYCGSSRKRK